MKGIFHIDLMEGNTVVASARAENIVLDSGLSAMSDTNNTLDMFYQPQVHIGRSTYPAKFDQPGNLEPLFSLPASVLPCNLDDGNPNVFFSLGAAFAEGDGNSAPWGEISLNNWNRALFTAPSSLVDGNYDYALCTFNASGESALSSPRTLAIASPAMASQLTATQGLTSLPSKIELLDTAAQDDTISVDFMTLTWAVGVAGCIAWVAAVQPDSSDAGHHFSMYLKRSDGKYYYSFDGFDFLMTPQPTKGGSQLMSLPRSGIAETWRGMIESPAVLPKYIGPDKWDDGNGSILTEVAFWGTEQTREVALGTFGSVHQSYYKVSSARLGVLTPLSKAPIDPQYGYRDSQVGQTRYAMDFIDPASSATDPTQYPMIREYFVPFKEFWYTAFAGHYGFNGEVFEKANYFRLTMYDGIQPPAYLDRSQFQVYGATKTGGAYLEWSHPTIAGPSGWPTGYRIYRRPFGGTFQKVGEVPVAYLPDPYTGVMTPHGEHHFWDRGEVAPGAGPTGGSGPAPLTDSGIIATAQVGLLPKPIVKTEMMKGRLHVQIFFYDQTAGP